MMRSLKVLIVEDNEIDFLVLDQQVRQTGRETVCKRVQSERELVAALKEEWNLVLADFNVPGMDFDATLRQIKACHPDLPIILVSGGVGEETAVELLQSGLSDFVLKGSLHRLVPAIERALADTEIKAARKRAEAALQASEDRYRSLVAAMLDALLLTAEDGRILSANEAACRLFGRSEAELIRMGRAGVVDMSDPRLAVALAERAKTGCFHGELRFVRGDGSHFEGEITSAFFRNLAGEVRSSMVIRDVTERAQAAAILRESEAQLHALTARLQAVREEERTRIARDVHDVLGQQLTGLTLDMAWLQKRLRNVGDSQLQEVVADKFGEIRQLTDMMIQTVQEISSELRPSVLDNLGLCSAIRFESSRFEKRSGIACELALAAAVPSLTAERNTGVFRIFQEILTNIARHAAATQVQICLAETENRLLLKVCDNGRGITVQQQADSGSLGLLGMRERAAQIGGEIRFAGEPGIGTTVTLTVPI